MHYVYEITDKNNEVVYYGETKNMRNRFSNHHAIQAGDTVKYLIYPSIEVAQSTEMALIYMFKPLRNKKVVIYKDDVLVADFFDAQPKEFDNTLINFNYSARRDSPELETVDKTELSKMIACISEKSGTEKVLSWLISSKDFNNIASGTQREIAKELGTSPTTVSKVFKALSDSDYMRIKHSGCYMINPSVMHAGNNSNKQAALSVWDSIKVAKND